MLKRILIANRGEIAVRIIRACREMNIESVAIYSTADADALHVKLATEAVCVGPAEAGESYLNMQNIVTAALRTGCDAVHPGFGFLSENADFVDVLEQCGLVFIGPPAKVIRNMGDKAVAKKMMLTNKVPVVPGSEGIVEGIEEAEKIAKEIGFPVLIKASAGGGGRGMRIAAGEEELYDAFYTAKKEAFACFGNDDAYIEKLIEHPKHIEVQILADTKGHVIHLGERECSIQRRNQKILEESPSKALSEELREQMGQAAVLAAKASGYVNAGTVEFVVDPDGNFYFIEMNTRIQVEHGVTELVSGVDIVREQIRIASGLSLSFTQKEISLKGHAMECRINAEDPSLGFLPSPGRVDFLHLPGGFGVRIDTALFTGCEISPYYDSMVAKILVHGTTRLEAIHRMRRALEEFLVDGVKTNQDLLYLILYNQEFIKGKYDTGFLEKHKQELGLEPERKTEEKPKRKKQKIK